jgi:hypothetical protein
MAVPELQPPLKHAGVELRHLDGQGSEDCVPNRLGVGAHDDQVLSGFKLLVVEVVVCQVLQFVVMAPVRSPHAVFHCQQGGELDFQQCPSPPNRLGCSEASGSLKEVLVRGSHCVGGRRRPSLGNDVLCSWLQHGLLQRSP